MKLPFSYTVDSPQVRLDLFLVAQTSKSRSFIKEQILAKNVLVNGTATTKASQKLKAGDKIEGSFFEPERLDLTPIAHPLEVLYEDEELLAINKAQGVVVHPAVGHRGETLVHYLLHHFQTSPDFSELSPVRPGIVHRLDRGTSGVLLVAKNRTMQEKLSSLFKQRLIKKEYEAVTWGRMKESGTYSSIIGRDVQHRKKMSSNTSSGREATTKWKRITEYPHFTHVALFPRTGRTHQLRVHLSEGGNPIVGDDLYGKGNTQKRLSQLSEMLKATLETANQTFLHAKALTFTHPGTGKELYIEAPRPSNFDKFLIVLRNFDK